MAEDRFRGTRLEIATVLDGRKRTLYETARALGRRSGDIQKTLRQMLAEGVLEAEHDEPEPGTRFCLAEAYEPELAEALAAGQIPGLVQENQDLLLLSAPSRTALNEVFAEGDLAAPVSWSARLGGTAMLIAVASKATEVDYSRLLSMLEANHIGVSSYRTGDVSDGQALRATSIASNEAVSAAKGEA